MDKIISKIMKTINSILCRLKDIETNTTTITQTPITVQDSSTITLEAFGTDAHTLVASIIPSTETGQILTTVNGVVQWEDLPTVPPTTDGNGIYSVANEALDFEVKSIGLKDNITIFSNINNENTWTFENSIKEFAITNDVYSGVVRLGGASVIDPRDTILRGGNKKLEIEAVVGDLDVTIDSSNITLHKYPNTRVDITPVINMLYTDVSGKLCSKEFPPIGNNYQLNTEILTADTYLGSPVYAQVFQVTGVVGAAFTLMSGVKHIVKFDARNYTVGIADDNYKILHTTQVISGNLGITILGGSKTIPQTVVALYHYTKL